MKVTIISLPWSVNQFPLATYPLVLGTACVTGMVIAGAGILSAHSRTMVIALSRKTTGHATLTQR